MNRALSLATIACGIAVLLSGCDKSPSSSSSSSGTAAGSAADVKSLRADLMAELSEAKEHVAAKHLDKLHEPAAHIWGLAKKLRTAKAPYGRLFKLARDLDAQGDAGNAGGVAEVMAALEKESASPSSPDIPDDGSPLAAEEHDHK